MVDRVDLDNIQHLAEAYKDGDYESNITADEILALIAELREARALINDYRKQSSADVAQISRAEEEIVKLRAAVRLLLDCAPDNEWDWDRHNQVRRDLNIVE